jgi:DNA-binding MarR family transcriptional regulator
LRTFYSERGDGMSLSPAEFSQLWHNINRQMKEIFRKVSEENDLPPLSHLLLRHIQKDPGITVSELARKVGAAKSHISTLIEQLSKEDLVEKRSDPADQRILRVYLNQAAIARLNQIHLRHQSVWETICQQIPEKDLPEIEHFFHTFLHALEQAYEKAFTNDGNLKQTEVDL